MPGARCSAISTTFATRPHEQVELSFGRLHLGDVDVKEPDGVTLEPLSFRLVTVDIGQAGDAMPLQASVQR